jgi:electron transfer flavoprotein beta subunit
VIDVELGTDAVRATRRLDGGRRELLRLNRGVISVEGSVATLRRAGLTATLAAASTPIDIAIADAAHQPPVTVRPYRPRPRAIATPRQPDSLDRLRQLTDAAAAPSRGELVSLDPQAAAERVLEQLAAWGYR